MQGFCAETGGAITLFLATWLGVPVSTTHTITGAIVGVGAARRVSAVRWNVAGQYRHRLGGHHAGVGADRGDYTCLRGMAGLKASAGPHDMPCQDGKTLVRCLGFADPLDPNGAIP